MKMGFTKRLLSFFLAAAIVLGLLPTVATPKAEAATGEEIASQTASLLADLKSRYGSLQIPKTKAKYVTTGNAGSLAGTYFMVIYSTNNQHRMINYASDHSSRIDRLNANCYTGKAATSHSYLPSLHVVIANPNTVNGEFSKINGVTPENLLDYAVEFRPNTVAVNYNDWYEDDGKKGWQAYTKWEYERVNKATGGSLGFGPYMGVNGVMSSSDPAYNILSLHPTRSASGNPWVGTYDTWGNAGYRTSAMPIFIKPNSDGRTFKMYKVDFQNATNCYTYWFGVEEYYSDASINAHTISQIVREDKNLNTTDYPNHNAFKYATDWELFQVSPSTLELYKALYEAKSYVFGENSEGKYPEDAYLDFLQYASTAMTNYNNNRGTFDDAATSATRAAMDGIAENLRDRMERLDVLAELSVTEALKTNISALDYPLGQTLSDVPGGWTGDFPGIYLIVSTQDNGSRKHTTLNPDRAETDGNTYVGYAVELPKQVQNNGTHFFGSRRQSYSILSGSPTDFTIQSMDGRYWNFEDISGTDWKGLRLGTENANRFTIGVYSGRYHEIKRKSDGWYLNSNSWTFRAKKVQPANDEKYFWFAKVCDELFYLRDTLQDAIPYLIDNSSGRYDATDYANFLNIVQSAYNFYYDQYDELYTTISSETKATANAHRDAIYNAIAKLKLSDSTLSYIDIPIEILDFRGDGFLFESLNLWSSPYSLSQSAADKDSDRFPGRYVRNVANNTTTDNFQVEGLVEDELVKGKVVYTKKTVDYIAYHLSQKTDLKTPTDKSNRIFYDKVNAGLPYDEADG